jgi:hypothetical protein
MLETVAFLSAIRSAGRYLTHRILRSFSCPRVHQFLHSSTLDPCPIRVLLGDRSAIPHLNMPDYSGERTHTSDNPTTAVSLNKRKQPAQQPRQLLSCTKCRSRKVKVSMQQPSSMTQCGHGAGTTERKTNPCIVRSY